MGSRDSAVIADAPTALPQEVLAALVRLLGEVRYGSIEIVVHEGRVTQIERREKMRIQAAEPHR